MDRMIRLTSVDVRLTVDGQEAVVVDHLQLIENDVRLSGKDGVVPWEAKNSR